MTYIKNKFIFSLAFVSVLLQIEINPFRYTETSLLWIAHLVKKIKPHQTILKLTNDALL